MIVLIVAVFLVMLGIALYASAFIASYSTQNSRGLTVTPLSYIHSSNDIDSRTSSVAVANYTGLFYVQHIYTYHE